MSKSVIALIVTWVLIGLAGAFWGGYLWAKKDVCKIDDKNGGNVIIDDNALNNSSTTVPNNGSNTNNSGKTVIQPIEQK